MPILFSRRHIALGGGLGLVWAQPSRAAAPDVIASGVVIGREKLLVVRQDANGRIVALDSGAYLDKNSTDARDVVVIGSYCGTRVLSPLVTRGVKGIIATDAGIGKDDAGISGVAHGEKIGVPVASIDVMSAETSNGRQTMLGAISRANAPARALGVQIGMAAWEAADLMARAPAGRPIPTPAGDEEAPVVVEDAGRGRIWATPGTTAIHEKIPRDVICSGANSSRVMSDGVLRMGAKGAIANDAGIARNKSAVEGIFLLAAAGVPAASVATLSARLGEGLSTWNDGVISIVNDPAAKLGVRTGMSANAAARLMLG